MSIDPLIKIDHLRVIYNQGKSNETRALEETNISIYPHEYVIIYGPSGCGKSTLLYSISGLQSPTYGDVIIRGKSLTQMNRLEELELHQTWIGMVFQAFYLIPSLNILDNVCLPKVFRGEHPNKREQDGLQLLRRFSITEQSDKFPSQLSGGQKQRVAIARSLINNPEIILADEPVGNLDSESAQNVMDILKELNDIDKKTIILVTHNPEHLVYADRIIYMKDGRVIKEEVIKEKRPIEAHKKEEEDTFKKDKEEIDPELKMLMLSFKNLLPQQVDILLIPFKAKQLLSHLLSQLNDEQVSAAESFLKEVLFKNIDTDTLSIKLDEDMDKGGAGWNKIRAALFSNRVKNIMEQAQMLKNLNENSVPSFLNYLINLFKLNLSKEQHTRFQTILKKRVDSKIDQQELFIRLDAPLSSGGAGLHRTVVEHLVKEVEIIMLLKYS